MDVGSPLVESFGSKDAAEKVRGTMAAKVLSPSRLLLA